jgi:uncharacterized protein (DUF58 family)
MIPPELAKKVRYIEIQTSRKVNDVLAGEYHSVFKGQGMEFEEVREYAPGDEVRSIDWNVTARMGRPYVKRFREERELTILLLVDLSASGAFGTRSRMKNEVAAELCALLAFSAIKNNDKVGLIAFTDRIEWFVPPAKGSTHVLRLIRDLLVFKPEHEGTDIAVALDYLGRVMTKRGIVFLVSDFLCEEFEKSMRIAAQRHDVIAAILSDPAEHRLPKAGLIELEDAESGERVLVDTSSPAVRKRYEQLAHERNERIRSMLTSMDVEHIRVGTDHDYVRDLLRFFKARERQR